MNKAKRFSIPAVGGSSLLVIFAVLALTIFAMLSLGTVQAGSRLSQSDTGAVGEYYAADCRAEEILAQLRSGEVPENVAVENGICYYECEINENSLLAVELRLEGDSYEILRWQVVSTVDWETDESLPVWNGK